MKQLIIVAALQMIISGIEVCPIQAMSYLSVTPATESTYLAILVPMTENSELLGIKWYNNNSNASFAEVKILQRNEYGMPLLSGAYSVTTDLSGPDTTWVEYTFPQPISSEVGDIFIALQYPLDPGEGNPSIAPGIGYIVAPGGPETWITSDGVDWTRLGTSVSIYFEALYGANKSLNSIVIRASELPIYITGLSLPRPNPFNPSTTLRFTVSETGYTKLVIYDTRGALVKSLVSQELLYGTHEAIWNGQDDQNRPVASGLYFARLSCKAGSGVQRLMLVR